MLQVFAVDRVNCRVIDDGDADFGTGDPFGTQGLGGETKQLGFVDEDVRLLVRDLDLDLVLLLGVAIFSAAYGLYLLRAVRAAYEMDDGPLDKTAVELVRHQAISMMPKGKIMSRKVLK